ncbi:MAG: hypothetical protein F6K19_07130 [Cyanothece sp. SIO1E1]|nr:hypothetical protein [Cyanothece sp. SIO1E1]
MSHTYEVFVDIKEYSGQMGNSGRMLSARYEIDAESTYKADYTARGQAESDYPTAAEYDVRVTRLLH